MHLLPELWVGAMLFLAGVACGMLAGYRRYTLAIQDRDAEAKRQTEMLAGYMTKGVDFNQKILSLIQLQNAKPKMVSVDGALLTHAADGAGFTIVKAKPRVTEKMR